MMHTRKEILKSTITHEINFIDIISSIFRQDDHNFHQFTKAKIHDFTKHYDFFT